MASHRKEITMLRFGTYVGLFVCSMVLSMQPVTASELDRVIQSENTAAGVTRSPEPTVSDLAFLRRASLDLIGRIPSGKEIVEFQAWPAAERRQRLVDKLIDHPSFADRWSSFFADVLRIRSNVDGGQAMLAYVHKAIQDDMPYDELARRLIATNGKAGRNPEVGFVLGDNADPMALASATSQVFLGIRIGCAQCHNHPFAIWTREDFYGIAAYFGKVRRMESRLTNVVYTTEAQQTSILWPPEDEANGVTRQPMQAKFPFELTSSKTKPAFIARLEKLRSKPKSPVATEPGGPGLDDLLDGGKSKRNSVSGTALSVIDVARDAKKQIGKIDVEKDLYRHSDLRVELADLITSPRNRYFSRALVNRVWKQLIGRGFIEPVDDFRDSNRPTHPQTLDYLADEFVANGYSVRSLVKQIVSSQTYQLAHAPEEVDEATREELELAMLAAPVRRMIAESLYDSIVTAGHLFDVKHRKGQNIKTRLITVRVPKDGSEDSPSGADAATAQVATIGDGKASEMMADQGMVQTNPYDLESAIELDFSKLLSQDEETVEVEKMKAMSAEEIEAMRVKRTPAGSPRMEYVTKRIAQQYDDNPAFNSAFRMASPAPAGHFLRLFGQPARTELGEQRPEGASMRQALLMLNGRMTHEASRVGELEPIYPLLVGPKADLRQAIRYAYSELLTRLPTEDEVREGMAMVNAGENQLAGMADLRWVLLNCNEFRFIP
ncbi:MAG TPA: hypothetical protein DCY79_01400 [Planctomycetaceae bacterium]|nr:hypothetical protein [Planctomycetaceae bacterium]